jgi:hypothetical protein
MGRMHHTLFLNFGKWHGGPRRLWDCPMTDAFQAW